MDIFNSEVFVDSDGQQAVREIRRDLLITEKDMGVSTLVSKPSYFSPFPSQFCFFLPPLAKRYEG